MSTFSDDRLGNFVMAENYLQKLVTKFLVKLTRENLNTPEVIDNMTGEELEKMFANHMLKRDA